MGKPRIGEPCNGCGICCQAQVCRNGAYLLGLVDNFGETVKGPCPAMRRSAAGVVRCDIVINPKRYIKSNDYMASAYSRNFALLIGAGTGCDELLDDDTQEEEAKLDAMIDGVMSDAKMVEKLQRAVRIIHNI